MARHLRSDFDGERRPVRGRVLLQLVRDHIVERLADLRLTVGELERLQHVLAADDAEQPAIVVDDRQHLDAFPYHLVGRVRDARLNADRDRALRHHFLDFRVMRPVEQVFRRDDTDDFHLLVDDGIAVMFRPFVQFVPPFDRIVDFQIERVVQRDDDIRNE